MQPGGTGRALYRTCETNTTASPSTCFLTKQLPRLRARPNRRLAVRGSRTPLARQSAPGAIATARKLVSPNCETRPARLARPSSTCLRYLPGNASRRLSAAFGLSPSPSPLLSAVLRFVASCAMQPQVCSDCTRPAVTSCASSPGPLRAAASTALVPSVCLAVLHRRRRTQKNGGSSASGPHATSRESMEAGSES